MLVNNYIGFLLARDNRKFKFDCNLIYKTMWQESSQNTENTHPNNPSLTFDLVTRKPLGDIYTLGGTSVVRFMLLLLTSLTIIKW